MKKPKIKLNTSSTPKAANGTPKAKEESAAKASVKAKAKKGSEKKSDAAKDAKATPEERRARKEVCLAPKRYLVEDANSSRRKRSCICDTSFNEVC